ncbi:uncharacterized protein [Dermacentor albipictus]|uniref:uncharacterized protein n=1 Tax=Dermacentor albipictus TaxID=60249 RepID=UPI0031FBCC8B
MTSSASDAPVTKSDSLPVSDEALPAQPSPSSVQTSAAEGAVGGGSAVADEHQQQPAAAPASGGHEGEAEPSDASVTKEEMERYIKISRDLKLRRGSLMPPGGTSGKAINATMTAPILPLSAGLKKKASLTMEARVELYGKGRVKLSFDGVSEEGQAGTGGVQPLHQDESATSLVRRGGPSTAITPRRLSLEERAPPPPPTPAPSLASLQKRNKSMDFATIPLKDDDHPEPSNPA